MSEYYAVVRSGDNHLAHYGVKGMKWGVRKAIERGDAKALGRHYAKALKKLNRLESNANITTQERRASRNKKIAAAGLGVGAAGAAGAINQHLKQKIIADKFRKAKDELHNVYSPSYMNSQHEKFINNDYEGYQAGRDRTNKAWDNYYHATDDATYRDNLIQKNKVISAGIGAAGLGTAAVAGGRAVLAKYRSSKKGHAKAEAKANEFRKQFNSVFNTPEAKKLASMDASRISKAKEKSAYRINKESSANKKYEAKQSTKRARKRTRLERKIGKI